MNRGAWNKWATTLKKNTYALYLASRNQRVPLIPKNVWEECQAQAQELERKLKGGDQQWEFYLGS